MIGTTISHYKILEKLGQGGMGVVYKAEDTRLDRTVALKVLAAHLLTDEEAKSRFEREAKAAAGLDGPNIATVFEIGEDKGQSYIALQFVDGPTIEDKIAERPLPLDLALDIAIQVAEGLQEAHEKGVIHRDIKAANILLSSKGQAKITDFGLAHLAERSRLTKSGTTLGTPAYMSPEQAQGQETDHRSDIWSLGVLLYEMVTGKHPFPGEYEQAVVYGIINEKPEPVTALRSGLPIGLDRLLGKAMAKSPDKRYQHAEELIVDFRGLLSEPSGEPVSVALGDTGLVDTSAHEPRTLAKAAAALVLMSLGALLAWSFLRGSEASGLLDPNTRLQQLTFDNGLAYQPAISPDGKMVAYASDRAGKGNLDIWVQQTAGGQPFRLTSTEVDEREPSFSPDGSRVAFRSEGKGGGVYIVPTLGGEPHLVASGGRRPRFSPNGDLVAYWVGREHMPGTEGMGVVFVVPVEGGDPVRLGYGRSPIWSPDGQGLLFLRTRRRPTIREWVVVSAEGGEPVPTGAMEAIRQTKLSGDPNTVGRRVFVPQDWLPDGRVLFSGGAGSAYNLWSILVSPDTASASGSPARVTLGSGMQLFARASANGAIAFSEVAENRDIWLLPIDARQGEARGGVQRATTNAARDDTPSLSVDGQYLAFRSTRSGGLDVWFKDLATPSLRPLTETSKGKSRLQISVDGRIVSFATSSEVEHIGGSWDVKAVPVGGGIASRLCVDCGYLADLSDSGQTIITFGRSAATEAAGTQDSGTTLTNVASARSRVLDRSNLGDPRFSPNEEWVSFQKSESDLRGRRLFVAPIPKQGELDRNRLIPITAGSEDGYLSAWSPDGGMLYFLSDRDGFRCLYVQRLDPNMKEPRGEADEVYHSHGARVSLGAIEPFAEIGLSVAEDKIALSMAELTGEIWLMESAE